MSSIGLVYMQVFSLSILSRHQIDDKDEHITHQRAGLVLRLGDLGLASQPVPLNLLDDGLVMTAASRPVEHMAQIVHDVYFCLVKCSRLRRTRQSNAGSGCFLSVAYAAASATHF
jgi:hypothetical protein